jgi:hypothetical protein
LKGLLLSSDLWHHSRLTRFPTCSTIVKYSCGLGVPPAPDRLIDNGAKYQFFLLPSSFFLLPSILYIRYIRYRIRCRTSFFLLSFTSVTSVTSVTESVAELPSSFFLLSFTSVTSVTELPSSFFLLSFTSVTSVTSVTESVAELPSSFCLLLTRGAKMSRSPC